ncbi:hypothetical protein ADUPG1_013127, partial [Aduncisulcus paluster]
MESHIQTVYVPKYGKSDVSHFDRCHELKMKETALSSEVKAQLLTLEGKKDRLEQLKQEKAKLMKLADDKRAILSSFDERSKEATERYRMAKIHAKNEKTKFSGQIESLKTSIKDATDEFALIEKRLKKAQQTLEKIKFSDIESSEVTIKARKEIEAIHSEHDRFLSENEREISAYRAETDILNDQLHDIKEKQQKIIEKTASIYELYHRSSIGHSDEVLELSQTVHRLKSEVMAIESEELAPIEGDDVMIFESLNTEKNKVYANILGKLGLPDGTEIDALKVAVSKRVHVFKQRKEEEERLKKEEERLKKEEEERLKKEEEKRLKKEEEERKRKEEEEERLKKEEEERLKKEEEERLKKEEEERKRKEEEERLKKEEEERKRKKKKNKEEEERKRKEEEEERLKKEEEERLKKEEEKRLKKEEEERKRKEEEEERLKKEEEERLKKEEEERLKKEEEERKRKE